MRGAESFEGLRRLEPARGEAKDPQQLAQSKAAYLKPGAAGNGGIATTQATALDSSVGFANAPTSSGLFLSGGAGGAAAHVNVATVAQAWAYQGSKAAYADGRIVNAQGNALNCLDAADGQIRWQGLAKGKEIGDNARIFAPPALGRKNMYLCSVQGHLLSVRQEDGRVGFLYATKQPMAFQPALSGGNIYVGTTNGLLICLKTGDPDAEGWTAWGGNAPHNNTETKK
jgi:outer membrane protein assembly factor BamB